MTNDLVNVENIHNDFCIYEIGYETRVYDYFVSSNRGLIPKHTPGKPKWLVQKSFVNLKDKYKSILKTEYRFFIDRQTDISRRHGLDFNRMILLLNRLSARKLIPLSLQPRTDLVLQCKGRRSHIDGRISKDDIRSYKSIQLLRYTFRAQLNSYLIQKQTDIFEVIQGGEDRETYIKMILVFRDMDTATKNYITFNQAVDNLYEKAIKGWK